MHLSPAHRILLTLLAVVAVVAALSPPAASADSCYFLEEQDCSYDSGGYCHYSCPSASYCWGDTSGFPSCYSGGIVCCYF
jgi:hypothetical protein